MAGKCKNLKKADILTIYLLSKITKTHCLIHVQNSKYWSALENEPTKHDELMQRCNLHLANMGQGNFVQLELRTTLVKYEIFGVLESIDVEQVDTKWVVLGTLIAEDETLTQLLETGLSVHVSENKTHKSANVSASASVGGAKDTLRLEPELAEPGPSPRPSMLSSTDEIEAQDKPEAQSEVKPLPPVHIERLLKI